MGRRTRGLGEEFGELKPEGSADCRGSGTSQGAKLAWIPARDDGLQRSSRAIPTRRRRGALPAVPQQGAHRTGPSDQANRGVPMRLRRAVPGGTG